MLAVEPQLGGVHGQHAIDGEVAADIAQERNVVERHEPLRVVAHESVCLACAELEELGKRLAHALLVGFDLFCSEYPAGLVFARGVPDAGCAAAHEHDRLAAGFLQPMQHHDGDEATDVQRRCGAIVADVGHDLALRSKRIEAGFVGALVDKPALGENS